MSIASDRRPTRDHGTRRSLIAWLGVWLFWLIAMRSSHPSLILAFIVTTSLVGAAAAGACLNQLWLIPEFWRKGRLAYYLALLGILLVTLTTLALAVIRFSYFRLVGPDPNPFGVYKHFAIDLAGISAHVLAAAVIVHAWRLKVPQA